MTRRTEEAWGYVLAVGAGVMLAASLVPWWSL